MSLAEEIKEKQVNSLLKLIGWFGSQKRLAAELEVSKQVVSNWVSRGRISSSMAAKAQTITKGEIKKEELRPDVLEWFYD